jgi:ubiquinone/menaquinone biosynthesis C-methylase UbiE
MNERIFRQIGSYWAKKSVTKQPERVRWWESKHIIRHYNRLVCGRPVDGIVQGVIELLKDRFAHRLPFNKAISVGGASGWKERLLLSAGIVTHFTVYELSEFLIEEGRKLSRQQGLADRIDFVLGNAFDLVDSGEAFDLVYWDNALHHMYNVDEAVRWSREVLRRGGVFAMNDFVGPTRMQWSQAVLDAGTAVRQVLPARYLANPYAPGSQLERVMQRPDPQDFAATDPSECVDSASIIPAISKYFPAIELKLTGGVIYHGALSDLLHNFNESDPTDLALLDLLLQIDTLLAQRGDTHYAVAIAVKS